jgi:hypothetical protein
MSKFLGGMCRELSHLHPPLPPPSSLPPAFPRRRLKSYCCCCFLPPPHSPQGALTRITSRHGPYKMCSQNKSPNFRFFIRNMARAELKTTWITIPKSREPMPSPLTLKKYFFGWSIKRYVYTEIEGADAFCHRPLDVLESVCVRACVHACCVYVCVRAREPSVSWESEPAAKGIPLAHEAQGRLYRSGGPLSLKGSQSIKSRDGRAAARSRQAASPEMPLPPSSRWASDGHHCASTASSRFAPLAMLLLLSRARTASDAHCGSTAASLSARRTLCEHRRQPPRAMI